MEGKSFTILVISALLMLTLLAGCASIQTGEVEVQGGQEAQEEQRDMLMSGEEFDRITKCLDEQVPEIWNEWSAYVEDISGAGDME